MKYISFVQTDSFKRKTEVWAVVSERSGNLLGEIRWFASWRQYAFFPCSDTVWNPYCLTLVNCKIDELMKARKTK